VCGASWCDFHLEVTTSEESITCLRAKYACNCSYMGVLGVMELLLIMGYLTL
jgi:hypothetical protein